MIDLAKYITEANTVRLASRTHDGILRELLHLCLRDMPEENRAQLVDTLLNSRAMRDQHLGGGFVLTHTRRDSLAGIRVAVGLLSPPAQFGKGEPAHTVFCAVIPRDRSGEYLGVMARISRLWSDPDGAEAFRSADVDRILRKVAGFSD